MVHTGLWWEDLRKEDHLEYQGIDGRMIFKLIFKKLDGGMDWIELAQDRDRWERHVNAVINLRAS